MVQIQKCRSKKHSFGGCGDSRCPEGLSIQANMDAALADKDVMAYIAAKQLKDIEPNMVFANKGFTELHITHNKGTHVDVLKFINPRKEALEYVESLDRTHIPSFETVKDLQNYINDTYNPYASMFVREYKGYGPKKTITRLSVANMDVDADLRGAGIGSYFRKVLLKHCDEKGYIVSGTPTNSGDGSIEHHDHNHEEFKQHALHHRARLEHFYERNGYERNYGSEPVIHGDQDFWTKQQLEQNQSWVDKFNKHGQDLLYDAGAFVRWPNNTVPKELLAK